MNLNNCLCASPWPPPVFHSDVYHVLIWCSCSCWCLEQFLLEDIKVWICTQSLDRMNMLISSNVRLHTQITINCACNFSRLFVLKISNKLCIQCSVMYEYKRWTYSNISKWEYLCVQIWCNPIILCAHFSNLKTGRQITYHIGGRNQTLQRQTAEPATYRGLWISVIWHQSSAGPFKFLRLNIALNNRRKQIEKHSCELAYWGICCQETSYNSSCC